MASDGHESADNRPTALEEATGVQSRPVGASDRSESRRSPGGPVQVLLDQGLVSQEQLDAAIKRHGDNPGLGILQMLVKSGAVDEVRALQAVAGYCKFPFMRITAEEVDKDTFCLLPVEYLRSNVVIPLRRQDDAIVVAVGDPVNAFLLDDLKQHLQKDVQIIVSPSKDILQTIDGLTGVAAQSMEDILRSAETSDEVGVDVFKSETEEISDLNIMIIAERGSVVQYVNHVISSAIRNRASDIHIEPGEDCVRVRYRIDGVLVEQPAPPRDQYLAIISRLKIMAELDIAERRLPQDGRIRAAVNGRRFDFRISTFPTTHGEKCVVRILDDHMTLVGLDKLGMSDDTLKAFSEQMLRPYGIFLVTGPTGSGKSTTLYSGLRLLDRRKLNICTIEDPVEYELSLTAQTGVNERVGLTFPTALRNLLRQDPDVVMVGEIRDGQTARIAVQAALTGHLVLSTLHTNDAPSAIVRLIDIGVEPFLIGASVNAVLGQRLVRRLCPDCKTAGTELKQTEAAYVEKYGGALKHLYRGAGCPKCQNTGYKGRLGLYEMLMLDGDLRGLISRNASLDDIRHAAREQGMRTLQEDGLEKITAGLTTVEEVMRVTTAW